MLAATLHKLMIWSHEYFMRLHLWIACFPHVNLCLTPWVVYTCKTVVMIDFLFLLEINADIYLNPTLHSALWKIGVKQMGKECRSDGCDAEGWVTPFSALCLQSCHLQPEHGHTHTPAPGLWVEKPLSQSSLLSYSQIISIWWHPPEPAEMGLKSQPSFLLCPLTGGFAVVVGQATGRSLQAVPLAHPCSAQRINKEMGQAGWSLLWLMGTPKYKANHNRCCKIHFESAKGVFVLLLFF